MNIKRYSWIILLALVLLAPFVLQLFVGARPSSAAPAKDADRVNIITAHAEDIRREFADAFRQWYRGQTGRDVYVDYTALGTGDILRVIEDKADTLYADPKIHTYQIDLVWGGGDFFFDVQLKRHLQGVELDPTLMAEAFPSPTLNGLPLYDLRNKPPHWYGAALSSFGITYNRDVLRYLKLPDPLTWADLTDARYFNWVIAADPVRSTSSKQAFMAMVERAMADSAAKGESENIGWARGMGMIRSICSNARSFVDGSSTVPGIIASGDAAAGMTIDYYGRTEVEAVGGNRLGYVQPHAATITNPDPIAMLLGAEHRDAAKAFMEFVLSRQGQLLWNTRAGAPGGPKSTNLRRLPIMPSVYADMTNFTDKDDPFTAAAGFNKSQKREDPTFGILGELIQASCINCLEDLRETRREIEQVPDAKRRKELEARLGLFPFDMTEAERRKNEYNAKPVDPVKQLALMRAWTEEFRAEYQVLRAEAQMGK